MKTKACSLEIPISRDAVQSNASDMLVRAVCPACYSSSMSPLLQLSYDSPALREYIRSFYAGRADQSLLAPHAFDVQFCNQCDLVFQKAVPNGELLRRLYDEWIPQTAREELWSTFTIDSYRYVAAEIDFILQHFGLSPSETSVFDFGFGWSEWLTMARAFGCKVSGAEVSQERLNFARSLGIKTIDWDDIPEHQFHFINTEQVFEHLVRPRETLAHLAKALRPGGLLKVSVPNGRGMKKRLQRHTNTDSQLVPKTIMPIAPLEHINCFDHSTLAAMGRTVGLTVHSPKVRLLYNGCSGWLQPKQAMRNILRPIFRHSYPKSPYVYFSK